MAELKLGPPNAEESQIRTVVRMRHPTFVCTKRLSHPPDAALQWKSSALERYPMLPPLPAYPPIASASPSVSKTVAWSVRPVFKLAVTLNFPVEGSYSSALAR